MRVPPWLSVNPSFGPLAFLVALIALPAAAQKTYGFPGVTAVGQTSASLSVLITLTSSGVVASPRAVTQSASVSDFTLMPGGTCAQGTVYSAGQQCTAMVQFQPQAPGTRVGAVILLDANGNVLGETNLSGTGSGPIAALDPGNIFTVAGDIDWTYRGDGVPATQASIFLPMGVVVDAAGNLYIADSNNNRLRRVDAQTGIITTFAGTGTSGYSGDGGLATAAMVSTPAGLAMDGAGNLYFADTGNQAIRRVDAFTGIITTVAGVGTVEGYEGDGGAATKANLSFPKTIVFDATGNLYISDTGNNVVRVVNTSGIITTFAGTGTPGYNGDGVQATAAELNNPWGLAVGADGSLYIADMTNNSIRRVSPSGVIETVAGTQSIGYAGDTGPATSASLKAPAAVAIDPAGNLYIADSGNNRVRKVWASTGIIGTICGNNSESFFGDNGPATMADLYGPYALFLDSAADLFVADLFHNRVREISATQLTLQYPVMRVDKTSAPQPVATGNDGNADLFLTQLPLNIAALDPGTTTCAIGSAILPGQDCTLGAEFVPTSVGNPIFGSITVNSNAGTGTQSPSVAGVAITGTAPVIVIGGQVLSVNPTTISLVTSANPSLVGSNVTFTATVSGSGLTGTVAFLDGTTQLCSTALVSQSAACTISTLILGSHNITAQYSGDTEDAAATSGVLVQVVKQQPVLTFNAAPNPASVEATVTLTLTAFAPTGVATGTITFYDGTTVLGSASLTNGVATISTTSLTVGTHLLLTKYSGDAENFGGDSNTISEVIQATGTSIQLSSSNATVPVGASITFTAVVSNGSAPAPTGTVQFSDGGIALGSGVLSSNGVATFTASTLAPGVHSIVAAYSGDPLNGTSQSTALPETIQQITTTTTLVANANPISAGAMLQLAANVSAAANATGGPISGNVSFSDGQNILGVVAVGPNGTAVLSVNTLAVTTHSIIATYTGNTNYLSSTSASLGEVVQQTSTTTVLSSGGNPSLAGEPLSLNATVTSATGVPTGPVTIMDGAANIGTVMLNAKGVASLTTSTLTVGVHNLTAVYSGDSYYTTSSSQALQQTISLATTSLNISAPTIPVNAGVGFSVSGSLSGNGVAPTGTVTLLDGNTLVASIAVTATESVTFPGVLVSVGMHSLTLAYSGDANNAKAVSPIATVVIQQGASTETLTTSASPQIQGQPVTFTAVISSASPNISGPVTFMDGATVIASGPLNASGVATYTTSMLTVGSHSVSATYAGDANHAAANTASLTELIVQASTTAMMSSANPSVSGNSVAFTVKVTGNGSAIPTGTVTFLDGTTLLGASMLDATGTASLETAMLTVGSHTITANYGGDGNYFSSAASLIQTVQGATTQITLISSANPATFGQAVSFASSVLSNGSIATGSVSFTVDGNILGTAVLNAGGVATLTTSSLAPGNHVVVANYAGDGKASASTSVPFKISVLEATSIALASNANPTVTLSPVMLTVAVTNSGVGVPTGTITFMDGATQLGTSLLDATGTATLSVPQLAAGTHTLSASYGGDVDNVAGTSTSLAEVIALRPTSVTVSGTPNSTTNAQSVLLIGVVRSNGPVSPSGTITFTEGAQVLGTVPTDASGVATLSVILQTGTNNVVATYSGDTNYAESASQQTAISGGTATQFSMVLSPAAMTLVSKQRDSSTLTLTSVSGYTDTMEFGCLGLPFAATCTFSSPTMLLPADGTVSVKVTVDTGDPLGAGAVASSRTTSSNVLLCLLPAGLLLGFGLRRKGRRNLIGLLMTVIAVALTVSATGCSGLQVNGTPAGTYSFKVTASGQATGVTQSQVMTLTVTQ
jgi:sugar lactone lactonase YvrE